MSNTWLHLIAGLIYLCRCTYKLSHRLFPSELKTNQIWTCCVKIIDSSGRMRMKKTWHGDHLHFLQYTLVLCFEKYAHWNCDTQEVCIQWQKSTCLKAFYLNCDFSSSREKELAKKYYDKLFKEYCIADLSRYKENKVKQMDKMIIIS